MTKGTSVLVVGQREGGEQADVPEGSIGCQSQDNFELVGRTEVGSRSEERRVGKEC